MRPNSHPPRSLLTSERSASSSRSSTSSSSHASSSNQKSRSRMKCIISLGLILPALAAVIGVVAWAVSAEAVWGPPGKHAGKLQGSYELNHGHGGYEIPVLQERSDLGFHPKSVLTVQTDEDGQTRVISRDDPGIGADNTLPSDLSSDSNDPAQPVADSPPADSKDDPLYYVHFVPTKDSPVASSTPSSTSVSDLLSKIMSSSGVGKKGAPQFVVFAPMPDGLGGGAAKDKQNRKKIKYDDEEDDEEEERRIVRKRKKSRRPDAPVHDYVHASESGRTLGPQRTGDPSYANQGGSQQYYPPQPAQQPQQPQRNYGSGNTQSYAYSDNNQQQQQQQQQQQPQPPPYSNSGNEAQASGDSDRLGLISGGLGVGGPHHIGGHGPGKGLSISIGGGHGALPLSPLGLLKNLFIPILPKPRVNMNGKVVFGVVLEKGVGFGGGKPAVVYRK